jgi:hypothetical protein
MPGEPETPSPFPRSPLLQTEGRPFLVTLTGLLLVLVNLMLLSDMVFKGKGQAGPYTVVALGMILAGFGYWAMRRVGVYLVALCTVAIVVLSWKAGLPTPEIIRNAAKFGIYLLPGVLFWDRMK